MKRDLICDMGYDDSIVFDGQEYDDAIIGVTTDGNVVYDYEKMVDYLMKGNEISREEAEDFIACNTIATIPYADGQRPIVMYSIEEDS